MLDLFAFSRLLSAGNVVLSMEPIPSFPPLFFLPILFFFLAFFSSEGPRDADVDIVDFSSYLDSSYFLSPCS